MTSRIASTPFYHVHLGHFLYLKIPQRRLQHVTARKIDFQLKTILMGKKTPPRVYDKNRTTLVAQDTHLFQIHYPSFSKMPPKLMLCTLHLPKPSKYLRQVLQDPWNILLPATTNPSLKNKLILQGDLHLSTLSHLQILYGSWALWGIPDT